MWLYVPRSTCSPSAPVVEDSISASSWQFQALARSAWWRGKPSPSRTWYQRWNKVSWLRLLCGAMPEPSTAGAGVDAWTASLAASRANRIAWRDASRGNSTSEIYGPTPDASWSSRGRGSSLSRTSAACSRRGLTKSLEPSGYGETFASLVSRLRSDCSRRRKSARAMSGSGSSSSAWLTPDAPNGGRSSSAEVSPTGMKPYGTKAQVGLRAFQESAWPTPTANDWKGSGPTMDHADKKMCGDRLDYATEQLWSMPRSSDGEKGGPNQTFGAGGTPLPAQAVQWATPSVADTTGGRMTRSGDRSNELLLKGQSERLSSSLQDRIIYPVGQVSSHPRRSLNPLFVEWLMGWPPGWTLLAWTDFACSAMELSHFKQRMRSALSAIDLPAEAPPAQLVLFG